MFENFGTTWLKGGSIGGLILISKTIFVAVILAFANRGCANCDYFFTVSKEAGIGRSFALLNLDWAFLNESLKAGLLSSFLLTLSIYFLLGCLFGMILGRKN